MALRQGPSQNANFSGRIGRSTGPIRPAIDYTLKNWYPAHKRQGRNLRSALDSPAVGIAAQVSDSTNTSSRFLRSDGNTASTSRKAAIAISTADSGRVRKTVQSPQI